MYSFTLFLCVLVAALSGVDTFVGATAILETTVHRGIMFDRVARGAKTTDHGTRAVLLRGATKLLDLQYAAAHTTSAYRHVNVYVPCATHLIQTMMDDLVTAPVKGLLLEQCEHDTSNEELLALYFSRASFSFPVYFVTSGNESAVLQQALVDQTSSPHTDRVYLSIGKSETTTKTVANTSAKLYSVFSTLNYKPAPSATGGSNASSSAAAKRRGVSGERAGGMPRVLLTANYDTMGVAPAATTTAGASGLAAAMEVWRRLVSTAAKPVPTPSTADSHPTRMMSALPYSVSMLLGSSARINYAATTAWLSVQNEADMDKFKVVVCLDELLPTAQQQQQQQQQSSSAHKSSNSRAVSTVPVLYMHMSDVLMRSEEGSRLTLLAEFAAKAANVPLKVVPGKTNFHHYDLRFEHEVFANRQMPAVTFSTHRVHSSDQLFRGATAPLTSQSMAILEQRVDVVHTFVRLLLGMYAPPGAEDHVPLTASNAGDYHHNAASCSTGGSENTGESAGATGAVAALRQREWPGARSYLTGILRSAARAPRSCMSQGGEALRNYANALEQSISQLNRAARMAGGGRSASASAVRTMKLELNGIRLYHPYVETLHVYKAKSVTFDLMLLACTAVALAIFGVSEFGSARLWRSMRALL